MVVEFDKDYLKELYHNGKCGNKKYRFQPSIIKSYIRCIDTLFSAANIEELFVFRSLNYEVLTGSKQGVSSMRINHQYRLEFIVETATNSDQPIITICTIIDITNHYKQ